MFRLKTLQPTMNGFWPKQRFLDRKADFTGIYNDFMDDGIINTERYMVRFTSQILLMHSYHSNSN
jgi:hypothetical protein